MILVIIYISICLIIASIFTFFHIKSRLTKGPKGLIGDKGIRGKKGKKGIKGAKGIKGYRGSKGFRGYNDNLQGDKGPSGYKGLKGDIGYMGLTGLPGDKGIKGNRGFKGFPGNSGEQGMSGPPGDPGEYYYTLDSDNVKIVKLNKITRKVKCPNNHILTGIDELYNGYCTPFKLNKSCNNLINPTLDEKLDTDYKLDDSDIELDENDLNRKLYLDNEKNLNKLKNYKCKNNLVPIPINKNIIRCCSKNTDEQINKYLKLI